MSMALADSVSLPNYCRELAEQARRASLELTRISGELKNRWLTESAARIRQVTPTLIEANRRDLDRAEEFQLSSAQIDRLRLDEQRIEGIANGLDQIAALPDPLGEVLDASVRPSGLEVARVRVALGVVFFVFESRPNVTPDTKHPIDNGDFYCPNERVFCLSLSAFFRFLRTLACG